MIALLQPVCLTLLAVLLVGAAVQDMRTMTIADGFSLGAVGLFAISSAAGLATGRLPLSSVGMAVACAALILAAGTIAFAAGALGGGDVKLLAAVSLFAGTGRLLDFLLITASAGGLLGLAALAGAPIGQPAEAAATGSQAGSRHSLPYGPAIATGGLWLAASLVLS